MDSLTDLNAWHAAGIALEMLVDPGRLVFLVIGVIVGLIVGLIPGIGGLTGFALLVPFTYTMDPIAAVAMLIGMQAVTTTSDSIPAVLIGVPGTASAQALVLDGHQMAKRGEAARALSAGYTASLLGGVLGALMLAVSIPLIRPFVLAIGTPELFAITAMALAMVSTLSGNAPLRGLTIACFGILIAMIGIDASTAVKRWTGSFLYLWDGVPLVPVMLGLFALPELCDLGISRRSLAQDVSFDPRKGRIQGVLDSITRWFLILRSSLIGVLCGAIPGFSGSVVDWIAYGHAARTEKGASTTFSTGDVRGVIAPEAASNAINSGSLGTTLVFGVPGSAAMAILIGAMMVHGIVPGPKMLTEHLDLTYSMVWSMALSNVFGALACIVLSVQFAKIATLRYTLLLPAILVVVYIGAYQASRDWWDLVVLLLFGIIGWLMKRLNWPRPPLVLGFVLGGLLEQYLGISINRYGSSWLFHPAVAVILLFSLSMIVRPLFVEIRHSGLRSMLPTGKPRFKLDDLFYVAIIAITVAMLAQATNWAFSARIGPQTVGAVLLIAATLSLLHTVTARGKDHGNVRDTSYRGIYMDLGSQHDGLPNSVVGVRAAQFFVWLVVFVISMSVIGLIPSIPVFMLMFLRLQGREPWRLSLPYAAAMTLFVYVLFDRGIHVFWPNSLLGHYFPELARYVPSL